jgi:hypothetical protein
VAAPYTTDIKANSLGKMVIKLATDIVVEFPTPMPGDCAFVKDGLAAPRISTRLIVGDATPP